jgi:hypothetical protein
MRSLRQRQSRVAYEGERRRGGVAPVLSTRRGLGLRHSEPATRTERLRDNAAV